MQWKSAIRGETLFSRVTVRKGEYVVINCGWAMIALSAVARSLGPLHWFCYGPHSVWGGGGCGQAPREHPGPSQPLGSQALLHLLACLIPTYEWFSSASALSPSKKTFTEGKTNTDNNDIEFWAFFSLAQQQASWNWSYSVLGCFTFVMLFKIFHKTMLQE